MRSEHGSAPAQPRAATGGRSTSQVKPPPWHGWVVADLFLSELSSGIFLFAALGDLLAPGVYGRVSRIGYLVAFPAIIADLICLIADLGDPMRFYHMLRTFKLRSPMATGVWAISLYAIIAFLGFVLATADAPQIAFARTGIGAVGVFPALYVGAYKGVLLSATAQPGWKNARWLGAELSISSGMLGAASLLLIAILISAGSAVHGYRAALILMLLLELVATGIFLTQTGSVIARGLGFARTILLYGLALGAGVIVPLIITGTAGGHAALAAGAVLAMLGALAFRYRLVMMPHEGNA